MAQAGGTELTTQNSITFDLADLKHSFILRDGKNLPVNFETLIQKGDTSQNLVLKNGDFIYIPSSVNKKVYVLGEVNLQRALEMKRPVTLLQALSRARGVTEDAGKQVVVLRGSLTDPAVKIVDYEKLTSGQEKDFLLRPDDIVFVPERKTLVLEEILKLALRAFVARIASEAGSEVYNDVNPGANSSNNDFNFNLSP